MNDDDDRKPLYHSETLAMLIVAVLLGLALIAFVWLVW